MPAQHWIVTGGLGFIGSAFVRLVMRERPDVRITVLDAMTYAANEANVAEVASDPRYRFVRGDICDPAAIREALEPGTHAIVNFAAETHVDRSILEPEQFLKTDVLGTHVLLEAVRERNVARYLQVSTDEVYGDVEIGSSTETDPLRPRSPYAASKAGGDLQVLAYHTTFNTPVLITRGSNTYGPYQYPEKLIPLFVTNLLDDETVPVYGDGRQVRDWLHVGRSRARHPPRARARRARRSLQHRRRQQPRKPRDHDRTANRDSPRMGHARASRGRSCRSRPALFTRRIEGRPTRLDAARRLQRGLHDTVEWYRKNEAWWRPIKSGEFRAYYARQYAAR